MGQRIPVSLWLNYLSLDAPIIALLWQDFVARSFPSMLLPAGRCMLGFTVWAIYLLDRLLDVRSAPSAQETAAHTFCRNHRIAALSLLALILFADTLIAALGSRPAVFANGMMVIAGVVTYLGAFPAGRIETTWKKVSAAALFMIGVFVVAWTTTPATATWRLALPAASFGLLCFANLMLVNPWHRDRAIPYLLLGTLLLAAACALSGPSRWQAAVIASGAGLATLAFFRNRISFRARGVTADAMLLTPLFFLWMPTG